jgi:hypothetical protein
VPSIDGPAQVAATHMGVDLGRREIRMTEHRLHGAQVGTALEQISRKRVSQDVR